MPVKKTSTSANDLFAEELQSADIKEESPAEQVQVEPSQAEPTQAEPAQTEKTEQRDSRDNQQNNYNPRITRHKVSRSNFSESNDPSETIEGILDMSRDGHGILRVGFSESERDAYISTSQIRRLQLRPGDVITGPARKPKDNERFWGLLKVDKINGFSVDDYLRKNRVKFQSLTPVYPDSLIKLETGKEPISLRIIDMIAPIGKGQRSLIVSPPKAGKTTLLKEKWLPVILMKQQLINAEWLNWL